MMCFLLLTAFTVSIDSFVCGFSLSFAGRKKAPIVLGIALTVLVMCIITNYATSVFADSLNETTASLGGLILIGVGIYNLLKKDEKQDIGSGGIIKRSLITGFAVGLDGAVANLSLALMGINAFYVPVIIAAMHAIMISLGILLAETPVAKKFGRFDFLPPVILILLGIYKLTALFI